MDPIIDARQYTPNIHTRNEYSNVDLSLKISDQSILKVSASQIEINFNKLTAESFPFNVRLNVNIKNELWLRETNYSLNKNCR